MYNLYKHFKRILSPFNNYFGNIYSIYKNDVVKNTFLVQITVFFLNFFLDFRCNILDVKIFKKLIAFSFRYKYITYATNNGFTL